MNLKTLSRLNRKHFEVTTLILAPTLKLRIANRIANELSGRNSTRRCVAIFVSRFVSCARGFHPRQQMERISVCSDALNHLSYHQSDNAFTQSHTANTDCRPMQIAERLRPRVGIRDLASGCAGKIQADRGRSIIPESEYFRITFSACRSTRLLQKVLNGFENVEA